MQITVSDDAIKVAKLFARVIKANPHAIAQVRGGLLGVTLSPETTTAQKYHAEMLLGCLHFSQLVMEDILDKLNVLKDAEDAIQGKDEDDAKG